MDRAELQKLLKKRKEKARISAIEQRLARLEKFLSEHEFLARADARFD